jgi:hypothetical protein
MLPTVISFYTGNWKYSQYAERLKIDCERLGLDYVIEERPDAGDYLANCRQKPVFILECLQRLQRPVLWVDVDGSIYQRPDFLDAPDFDFAARPKPPKCTRKWHVCAMYFTPAAEWFVQRWVNMLSDWSDESALHELWQQAPSIKYAELPGNYMMILDEHEDPPADLVMSTRLSSSDQKRAFQAANRVRHGG